MVTYQELKRFVGRLFRQPIHEENDDDIVVKLPNFGYSEKVEENTLTIFDSELKELYHKVTGFSSNNLEFFSTQNYEVAIDFDAPRIRRYQYPIIAEDISNGIRYTLGYPSIEYCIFLLLKLIESPNNHNIFSVYSRLRRISSYLLYDNEEKITFETILSKMINELSLKIETIEPTEFDDFRVYKTSFEFQFMYRSGFPLIEFIDVDNMFHLSPTIRNRIDIKQLDTPPQRHYAKDVVDYYKQALASTDPYIKFISFYHVMEYFYDEVFKKKMVADLRTKITHPDFVYKDDEKIYDIALFVKNRLRMDDEFGLGDERESLKYVLSEYVPIDEIKTRISAIDPDSVKYYETTKVTFCNAPAIPWSDTQGVYTQIAKRIYFIRNSLVHSKSGKNHERYKPYNDEAQLQKEIPLVKVIAELIIINSSTIL